MYRQRLAEHIGQRLRELRRLAGCTQADVQRLTGIPFNRISMAECGHLQLTAQQHEAVERALTELVRERAAHLAEVASDCESGVAAEPDSVRQ